jgi:hypothetical protein
MHRHLVLLSVGLLLGAPASGQTPDDDFNTFPPAKAPAPQPPPTPPARTGPPPSQPAPQAPPPQTVQPPPQAPKPAPVIPPSAPSGPAAAPPPGAAAAVPPGGPGPAPAVEVQPGQTVERTIPGSPPPGPSTLGDPFVDPRNYRLSQGYFGGLASALAVSSAAIGPKGILRGHRHADRRALRRGLRPP